ncbi:MAG TPA: ribosome maturation factor RimM [Bacilli bacterium]|nr:MAG: Ribosome maturation factor RimM [Tenericutes bacterium ADurb.BinA124]HNZ50010.1 ribosome maturation factor RimM [Bacilli bacterium]HPN60546.1 ribosome maturation factor RimM [Bacilli bacterium]HPX84370.1 ribosome maturation factor RimM [Bacilli bacterium]HQC73979.1 ribosome maturation factor RimM [Bacilli bacterium]
MKLIEVGKIVGTHGIKGEVKIISDSDFRAERFQVNRQLFVQKNGKMEAIIINSHRQHKQWDLITFNHLEDINLVLDYVGCFVFVNRDDLEPLPEHEYYYDDLIGLDVVLEDLSLVGKVSDLTELPQGLLLVVLKTNNKEALIPFVSEFIKEVDLEKKRIIITPIEGLL